MSAVLETVSDQVIGEGTELAFESGADGVRADDHGGYGQPGRDDGVLALPGAGGQGRFRVPCGGFRPAAGNSVADGNSYM
ncbi:hypothetical protein GCM10010518_30920 [Kitasatospora cinereorecta]